PPDPPALPTAGVPAREPLFCSSGALRGGGPGSGADRARARPTARAEPAQRSHRPRVALLPQLGRDDRLPDERSGGVRPQSQTRAPVSEAAPAHGAPDPVLHAPGGVG